MHCNVFHVIMNLWRIDVIFPLLQAITGKETRRYVYCVSLRVVTSLLVKNSWLYITFFLLHFLTHPDYQAWYFTFHQGKRELNFFWKVTFSKKLSWQTSMSTVCFYIQLPSRFFLTGVSSAREFLCTVYWKKWRFWKWKDKIFIMWALFTNCARKCIYVV